MADIKRELTKHGITSQNTLYAQSACPDEINHEEGDLPNLLAGYLGEVFHMGGLAGNSFPSIYVFNSFHVFSMNVNSIFHSIIQKSGDFIFFIHLN